MPDERNVDFVCCRVRLAKTESDMTILGEHAVETKTGAYLVESGASSSLCSGVRRFREIKRKEPET